MKSETAFDTIKFASEKSTIIIDVHNARIDLQQNNLGIVDMEDKETIYLYDEANDNEYYIHSPSIEAVRVIGENI